MNPAYLSGLTNHLWQSTLFVGVAGLLTLLLRDNRARVRHWMWLAASWKFLIPFSILISLGGQVHWRTTSLIAQSNLPVMVGEMSQPFATPTVSAQPLPAAPKAGLIPVFLCSIWACGFLGIAASWWIRWRRIRAAVRAGSPVDPGIPVKAVCCPTLLEPGVFGVFRPVLLLPAGIFDRLTEEQLKGVIAHELCHVYHRDNLIAAIHMFVETVFWFYPLVWWIGKRMVEERERACDEEVLRLGGEPRVYAEGILNVCKLYVESPLACVAGVTGANLKRRIGAIMANRVPARVNFVTRLSMAVAGLAAVVIPAAIGSLQAPGLKAQSADAPRTRFEVVSVKPCTLDASPDGGGRGGANPNVGDPGMFRTPCTTLRFLIQTAYVRYADGQARPISQLKNQPVEGGPGWIDTDRFLIDAKPETPQPKATMGGPMLQALLEERFKLKIHRETRKVPAYSLEVAKGGPKLQATPEGGCTPGEPGGPPPPLVPGKPLPCGFIDGDETGIRAVGVPVAALCQIVKTRVHRIVIDKTGISGLFDFHLGLNTPPPGLQEVDDPDGFGLATIELHKLGLELKSTSGDAEFIVIDRVERPGRN